MRKFLLITATISFFKRCSFIIFSLLLASIVRAQELKKIFQKIESIPSYEEKINECIEKSNSFFIASNYTSSIKVARLGHQISESKKDDERLITFKILVGKCFLSMHQEDKGLNYFDEAETIAKRILNYGLMVDLHFEKAEVYQKTNNNNALKEELDFARKLIQKHGLPFKNEKADKLLGIYFCKTNESKKGEKIFKKITKNTTNEILRIEAMNNLGTSMSLRGELDSALNLFNRVYNLTIELGLTARNMLAASNLAYVQRVKGNTLKSLEYGNEALTLARQLNSAFFETYELQQLGAVHATAGDYNQATFNLFDLFKKKLEGMDETTDFLIDELAYEKNATRETQKLINEKNLLKRKKRNEKIVFISMIVSLIVIILLVLIGFIYVQSKKRKTQLTKNEETRKKLFSNQKELKYRGSQISQAFDETKEISAMINTMSEEFPHSDYIKKVASKMDKLNDQLIIQNEWQRFLVKFNETYPKFEKRLMKSHPGLSFNDKKVCIYVKAELSQEQIASIKDISIVGVKASFKRLEEKLNINKHLDLQHYLSEF